MTDSTHLHKPAWRLQDAKAQFSAVVEAAVGGEAQFVTRRGKRAVVIVSASEYERLRQGERALAPGFIDHLLAVPRSGSAQPSRSRAEPRVVKLRDVSFK